MPKFRVPFSGAVLVDTDEPSAADIYASIWAAAVTQLTLGVSPQKILSVKAVHFDFDSQHIEDITQELNRAHNRLITETDPIALQLGRAIDPDCTEAQACFEFYERDCRDA